MSRNKNLRDIPTLLMRQAAWLTEEIKGFKTDLEWLKGCDHWDRTLDLQRLDTVRARLQQMLALLEGVDRR